jgi:hypothetical protein
LSNALFHSNGIAEGCNEQSCASCLQGRGSQVIEDDNS